MLSRSLLLSSFLALSACSTTPEARGFYLPEGDKDAGKQTFVELGCSSCHLVAGVRDLPKPVATPPVSLTLGGTVNRMPSDGELVTAIIHPSHEIPPKIAKRLSLSGERSRMSDYKEAMSVQELVDLVSFLHSAYSPLPAREPHAIEARRGL